MKHKAKIKNKNIIPVELGEFAQKNMTEYGLFVIEDRAVADFRDGLKPSQRRIIKAMQDSRIWNNTPFHKSAAVVGTSMAYHPHGDCLRG